MKNDKNEMTKAQKEAIAANPEIQATVKDVNQYLTASGAVKAVFHGHFADMETGECGISDLISRILRENGSVFPAGIENSALRQIAIAGSMTTAQVMAEVQRRFAAGSKRHPLPSIKSYLGTHMPEKGLVGKIQLTGKEDINRTSCRPHCKWYLVA